MSKYAFGEFTIRFFEDIQSVFIDDSLNLTGDLIKTKEDFEEWLEINIKRNEDGFELVRWG